jgi:hypothetical protein
MTDSEGKGAMSNEPPRLLPGEPHDLHRAELADTEHWISVYMQLIESLKAMKERRPAEVQAEPDLGDVEPLELQLAAFERRLEFWQRRRQEALRPAAGGF